MRNATPPSALQELPARPTAPTRLRFCGLSAMLARFLFAAIQRLAAVPVGAALISLGYPLWMGRIDIQSGTPSHPVRDAMNG